jgi:hypothetical protein
MVGYEDDDDDDDDDDDENTGTLVDENIMNLWHTRLFFQCMKNLDA